MAAPLKVGVIGLGMGRVHLEGYQSHPGCTVTAICDTDVDRLEQVGKHFRIAGRYTDAGVMFAKEQLDVVSIAVPNKFHKPLTLQALQAGCHVLCEKPMAMNATEAQEMLTAARAAKRRLMINFSFRFIDQSQALKREVDTGILGDIYFGRTLWLRRRGMPGFGGWFGTKALSGGGPLIDLGVHRLDLALWLMGYPKPVWVMGNTWNAIAGPMAAKVKKTFDVEDFAAGMIRFENGAMLEVEASWASNIGDNEMVETRLLGTKGGLLQKTGEDWRVTAEIYTERNGCQYDTKLHPPVPGSCSSMYHFIQSILDDVPHDADGEQGLIVMRLLDALYLSAESGEPVKLD